MILPALVSLSLAASPAPQTYAKPEAALEKGALLLERRDDDLDGDGVAEAILAAGIPDPDGEPVSRGDAFNGAIVVHVLQRSGERWREVGRIELEGVPEPFVVADVGEGAERTRLLVTGADHCGASCNGMELHAHALRGGRLVAYLPDETKVWKGWVTVVPGKFVETWTRADEAGSFAECCPTAFDVARLVPRGGSLVAVEKAHVLAEEAERAGVTRATGDGRLHVANAKDATGPILPAAVLADRDWLVREARSVGKIRLGMKRAEVHALLGPPAASRPNVDRWGDRNRVFVLFAGDEAAQISVTSSKFHTSRGIRPGDPVAKVRAEFRGALQERAAPGGRTLLDAAGIAVEVSPDGRVTALIVHGEDANAVPLE